MQKNNTARRDFIKLSAMGISSLAIAPVAAIRPEQTADKLQIVCLGAHPGDPEFGCGGTMAKYSDAGHMVTFIYLTRGGASDPAKPYAELAALRTSEANTSCKILNTTPVFAGQLDGDTVLDKKQNEEMTKMILALNPDIVFT